MKGVNAAGLTKYPLLTHSNQYSEYSILRTACTKKAPCDANIRCYYYPANNNTVAHIACSFTGIDHPTEEQLLVINAFKKSSKEPARGDLKIGYSSELKEWFTFDNAKPKGIACMITDPDDKTTVLESFTLDECKNLVGI